MPRLSCWACGRQIYTVAPLDSLDAEERRCPRCGSPLRTERREAERRVANRRVNPTDDPGPPMSKGKGKGKAAGSPERRLSERREARRRGSGKSPPGGSAPAG